MIILVKWGPGSIQDTRVGPCDLWFLEYDESLNQNINAHKFPLKLEPEVNSHRSVTISKNIVDMTDGLLCRTNLEVSTST